MSTRLLQPSTRSASYLIARLRARVATVLLRERLDGQGRHVDPDSPAMPPPSTVHWTAAQRDAEASTNMALFVDTLRPPAGGTARAGVIDDLARYYQLSPEQVIDRCLHWEDESVEEWRSAATDTGDGLAQFYNSVTSWSFDLLWYSYLQTVGFGYPKNVIIADQLPLPDGARVLDFGSGIGATAQLFAALGHHVELADVSAPLLNFAQWRLEQRGVKATYVLLPGQLPDGSYDLIMAMDTLAHVPDINVTAQELYRATRPGGHLATNFDVRRKSERNAWHLYDDDLPLRWAIERNGYVPVRLIDSEVWIYQARPTAGAAWQLRKASAWVRLASPPARGVRACRRALARAVLVALQRHRRNAQ